VACPQPFCSNETINPVAARLHSKIHNALTLHHYISSQLPKPEIFILISSITIHTCQRVIDPRRQWINESFGTKPHQLP